MKDTQWPRYEVFKQDNEKKVHEAVGSVHAPDAEIALLNARDVFVRRPSAVNLWVVPESAIFSCTAEELAADPERLATPDVSDREPESFVICHKRTQRKSMIFVKHVGEVMARSSLEALQKALSDETLNSGDVYVWWVFPRAAVTDTNNDDIESMFAPALDKTYRQQSAYGFVHPKRQGRKGSGSSRGN